MQNVSFELIRTKVRPSIRGTRAMLSDALLYCFNEQVGWVTMSPESTARVRNYWRARIKTHPYSVQGCWIYGVA